MTLLQAIFVATIATTILGAEGQWVPLPNVTYGPESRQVVDIYLPSWDLEPITKVIILIHGGAWGAGEKEGMDGWLQFLATGFPTHIIANMGYRLGTAESPGFPKQLEDISLVVTMLQNVLPQNVTFALIGGSAGAQLAMLYSYAYDREAQQVKVVVSHVGPTDFTHSSYTANPLFLDYFVNLVGPCRYTECPELYNVTSPATWVSEKSAKTIGFYGNRDLLIPNAQMPIIRDKLTEAGVTNKFTVYNAGHGNWIGADLLDEMDQIVEFLRDNWD
ncbi:uncharacterized protein LOC110857337 [Folsomia candida]|uniref:Kynurenine formamidase n=1 Tax=Folsomia candida TaxID=158441 RepID=A0A226DLX8_FOLCA|nr:uncharacterized protein LOC110857337 [Folsomia candida]OXA45226.1 Kynurenine formamidase [Folsomia candida]